MPCPFQAIGYVHHRGPVSAGREDQWLLPAMDQSKSSVGAGLEVGLRRALFDGTTPASLGSLALQMMASTGAKNSHM